jgi:hypothetical protein
MSHVLPRREAYLQQQRLEAAKGARADLASLTSMLSCLCTSCTHTICPALYALWHNPPWQSGLPGLCICSNAQVCLMHYSFLFMSGCRREAYLQQQRLEAAKGARADLASLTSMLSCLCTLHT